MLDFSQVLAQMFNLYPDSNADSKTLSDIG
jgi:hypothetical protein